MSDLTGEFDNLLHIPDEEFTELKRIIKWLKNNSGAHINRLQFNVEWQTLQTLVSGADFDEKTKGSPPKGSLPKQIEVYEKIVVSIVRICSGLSTISFGLEAFQETFKEEVDGPNEQRDIFLAYLIKAFHQVKHGIIWDERDKCGKNTQPKSFFKKDFKRKELFALNKDGARLEGTTGWSKDDLEDKERIENPLLMQLFQAAEIEESDFESTFKILYCVDLEISNYMKALHEKLKSIQGTNEHLNKVNGKNLREFQLEDADFEGSLEEAYFEDSITFSIPLCSKKVWTRVMTGKKKRKKKKKKKRNNTEISQHTGSELIDTPLRDELTKMRKVDAPRVTLSPMNKASEYGSSPSSSTDMMMYAATDARKRQALYQEYLSNNNLVGTTDLKEYLVIKTVGNGHCGADAIIQSIKRAGSYNDEQLIGHTGERADVIMAVRMDLSKFLRTLLDNQNYDGKFRLIDGEQHGDFKSKNSIEAIACRLYEPGMEKSVCGPKHHFDTSCFAVAALFYRLSFVVYSKHDQMRYKATVFHDYNEEEDRVTTVVFDDANLPTGLKGMYMMPSHSRNAVSVLNYHDNVHFVGLLKQKQEKIKQKQEKIPSTIIIGQGTQAKESPYLDAEAKEEGRTNSQSEEEEDGSDTSQQDSFVNNDVAFDGEHTPTENDITIFNVTKKMHQVLDALATISKSERDDNLIKADLIKAARFATSLLKEVDSDLRKLVTGRPPPRYEEGSISSDDESGDVEVEENLVMKNKQGHQDSISSDNENGDVEGEENLVMKNKQGHQDSKTEDDHQSTTSQTEDDHQSTSTGTDEAGLLETGKKKRSNKKSRPPPELKQVEPSALLHQLAAISAERPDSTEEYVMGHLDIAQCLSDLINSCFNSDCLCFDKLQEGLTCLMKAMSPHIKYIGKFVVVPQEKKLASAFDQKAGLGRLLDTIEGIGSVSMNDDANDAMELKKIQRAILKDVLEYTGPVNDSTLDKRVGASCLKKHLTVTEKTKNMMVHCFHILLINHVITDLRVTNSVRHLSDSESKELREQLRKVSDTLHTDRVEEAPSSEEIDEMTIKELLNRIILPAITKGDMSEVKNAEEKPLWQVATKAMTTIFLGLAGCDARGKRKDGAACARDLYDKHILSHLRNAQSKTIGGDNTDGVTEAADGSTVAGEDYCCQPETKHQQRRRRIISTYLVLLLRRTFERAEESRPLLDKLDSHFGSYSGLFLRLSPTEMYSKTTSMISEDISIAKMKKVFEDVKQRGNFEKIYVLITSNEDMENLSSLATSAYQKS